MLPKPLRLPGSAATASKRATVLEWLFSRSSVAVPTRSEFAGCGRDRSIAPWQIIAKPSQGWRVTRPAPTYLPAVSPPASFEWRVEMELSFETWLHELRERRQRWVDASHENDFDR